MSRYRVNQGNRHCRPDSADERLLQELQEVPLCQTAKSYLDTMCPLHPLSPLCLCRLLEIREKAYPQGFRPFCLKPVFGLQTFALSSSNNSNTNLCVHRRCKIGLSASVWGIHGLPDRSSYRTQHRCNYMGNSSAWPPYWSPIKEVDLLFDTSYQRVGVGDLQLDFPVTGRTDPFNQNHAVNPKRDISSLALHRALGTTYDDRVI